MKIRKQIKKWKTKTGEKIRICDMTDSHLINATELLIRMANHKLQNAGLGLTITSECITAYGILEGYVDNLNSFDDEDLTIKFFPIAENLFLELERRGLSCNTNYE